jgi:hypothetical protein
VPIQEQSESGDFTSHINFEQNLSHPEKLASQALENQGQITKTTQLPQQMSAG